MAGIQGSGVPVVDQGRASVDVAARTRARWCHYQKRLLRNEQVNTAGDVRTRSDDESHERLTHVELPFSGMYPIRRY